MVLKWLQVIMIGMIIVTVESSSNTLINDAKLDQAAVRPRAKRAQEVLMFGNQQNRRTTENTANANVFAAAPAAEKRTLGTSGLEDVKAALAEGEAFNHPKQQQQQQQQPTFSIFDRQRISPYEKNYDYGKVIMNEIREDLPRNWDISPYAKYLSMEEDRRKRSDNVISIKKPGAMTSGSPLIPTMASASTSSPSPLSMLPVQLPATPRPYAQVKRSMQSSIYPEPRYKRALDRDDLLALLSLWENGASRGRNWRNYANDEYDNIEDESNFLGQDDEDSRVGGWLDGSLYAPPSHHFNLGTDMAPSEFGIPRTHPLNTYEQYGAQYNTPTYENTQYNGPTGQYASLLYPHASYYPPEKRFMVSRKRSQGYDSYSGRNINDIVGFSQMMNSQPQGYPNIPQRLFY